MLILLYFNLHYIYKIMLIQINQKQIWSKIKFLYKSFIILIIICLIFFIYAFLKSNKFNKDEITLVTCLYQIETNRHNFSDYLKWIDNLLQINKPIVFYTQPNLSNTLKSKRPKMLEKKTIWIEKDFSNLYSYIHYLKQFRETYFIDKAKYKHTVDLYIIWSEKMNFLKESIQNNYFNTTYFFWVDAGLFRKKNMKKYINYWPSIHKIKKDPRVILNGIREINKEELNNLMKFDPIFHAKFMNDPNVAAGFFGGSSYNILKFIKYYYEILELFYEKNIFIGSEQNIYALIGKLHPEIATIIKSGDYEFLINYFIANKKWK